MYPGFVDWNKWFVGDVMGWTIFNTNQRIAKLQAGFWPRQDVSVRAFWMSYWLDELPNTNTGRHFSDEVNLAIDYFPMKHLWVGALFSYINPDNTGGVVNLFNLQTLGTKTDYKFLLFGELTF